MARTKEDWMGVLAYNIRRLMRLQSITAEDLYRKTKVHPATISQMKNQLDYNPTVSTLALLAEGLNCDIPELFREPDVEEAPASARPRYLTFSQWFWSQFREILLHLGEEPGTVNEESLRQRFDLFLRALRPDEPFTEAERELIWQDRKVFLTGTSNA